MQQIEFPIVILAGEEAFFSCPDESLRQLYSYPCNSPKDLLLFYRTQVSLVQSMGLVLSNSLSKWATCANLTLADEDTNSILTDDANRAM